jgi:hypothetical protein
MTRPAYDPAKTYRFKSSAFPFTAADKVPATLDAEDVTGNLPAEVKAVASEAGYLLQLPDADATAVARGKTGYALSASGMDAVVLPADILTAASVKADAVTKIQNGLSTYDGSDTAGTTTLLSRVVGTLDAGTHKPQSGDSYPVVTDATHGNAAILVRGNEAWKTATGFAEAGDAITLTAAYDAAKTAAQASTALSNATWTNARAGYVDKLNVTGTLAHSDAAATYKATGFATPTDVTEARDAVIAQGDAEWKTATGFLQSLGSTAPAGWLNAAAFATDAISAAALSAAAVTKLQTGLATQTSVDLSKALLDRIIVPVGGTSSGSPDGTEIFEYGSVRMTSTVDSSGNRSNVEWGTVE